jgi:hypothetical protein
MLDVAVAYKRYRFLGDEFLTWLWYMVERQPDELKTFDKDLISFEIGNRIALENHRHKGIEIITIKGDDAGLEEGLLALKKGALVTEINIIFRTVEQQWQFNIKGESLNISGLKTPETARPETKEDVEGFVLEKIYLYDKIIRFIENLFQRFISLRVSLNWDDVVVTQIKNWITTAG